MLLIFLCLAGCSTFSDSSKGIKAAGNQTDSNLSQLNTYTTNDIDTIHTTPYLMGTEITRAADPNEAADAVLNQKFSLDTSRPLSLDQLASLITQETGVPVDVTPQADSFLSGQAPQPQMAMPPPASTPNMFIPPTHAWCSTSSENFGR